MQNNFKKSSKCNGSFCVEVNISDHLVTVRDAAGDLVMYTHNEWRAFIEGVKMNEFDI